MLKLDYATLLPISCLFLAVKYVCFTAALFGFGLNVFNMAAGSKTILFYGQTITLKYVSENIYIFIFI